MSLKDWLAKEGREFGGMAHAGAKKLGMPKLGAEMRMASYRHPATAGALGHIGTTGAVIGADLAARSAAGGLDSMTADPDAELPPHIRGAVEEMGKDPDDFHDEGIHPAKGAVLGAELGALAHVLRRGVPGRGSLAKYLAIGAAGGGALGTMDHSYSNEKRGGK